MQNSTSTQATDISKHVEAVARALYPGTKKHYFDNLSPHVKDLAFERAKFVISAYTASLEEQGMVIVPIEPTEEG